MILEVVGQVGVLHTGGAAIMKSTDLEIETSVPVDKAPEACKLVWRRNEKRNRKSELKRGRFFIKSRLGGLINGIHGVKLLPNESTPGSPGTSSCDDQKATLWGVQIKQFNSLIKRCFEIA